MHSDIPRVMLFRALIISLVDIANMHAGWIRPMREISHAASRIYPINIEMSYFFEAAIKSVSIQPSEPTEPGDQVYLSAQDCLNR